MEKLEKHPIPVKQEKGFQETPSQRFRELPGNIIKRKSGKLGGPEAEKSTKDKVYGKHLNEAKAQRKPAGIQSSGAKVIEDSPDIHRKKKYEEQTREYNERRKLEEEEIN